jgi:hypothetical protein
VAPGDIWNSVAPDKADPASPYIVFKLPSEPIELFTSDSRWGATRITFESVASTAAIARAVSDALLVAFGGTHEDDGISLAFAGGVTTPLVLEDRSQAGRHARGKGTARIFVNTLTYLARTRLG